MVWWHDEQHKRIFFSAIQLFLLAICNQQLSYLSVQIPQVHCPCRGARKVGRVFDGI
jgi:hypothetical protein